MRFWFEATTSDGAGESYGKFAGDNMDGVYATR